MWVAEYLDKRIPDRKVSRDNISFIPDKRIPIKYRVDNTDYFRSGYDRGHMAPAADHDNHLIETFIYSNCCPQLPDFNRGIWKNLEEHIRKIDCEHIWIITCPLYDESQDIKLGKRKIWVPSAFGKAILYKTKTNEYSMQAWIIPHTSKNLTPFNFYRVSVDEFENQVGLDLWNVFNNPRLEAMK